MERKEIAECHLEKLFFDQDHMANPFREEL